MSIAYAKCHCRGSHLHLQAVLRHRHRSVEVAPSGRAQRIAVHPGVTMDKHQPARRCLTRRLPRLGCIGVARLGAGRLMEEKIGPVRQGG
jgi:hypothetical protein